MTNFLLSKLYRFAQNNITLKWYFQSNITLKSQKNQKQKKNYKEKIQKKLEKRYIPILKMQSNIILYYIVLKTYYTTTLLYGGWGTSFGK
jgi:hypothetical protein